MTFGLFCYTEQQVGLAHRAGVPHECDLGWAHWPWSLVYTMPGHSQL